MKGQGLPISTIIIAALGILVLVIIAAIFGGQIGKFGRVSSECPNRCAQPADYATVTALNIDAKNAVCGAGETSLSGGPYKMKGQESVPADQLKYCSACCAPTG